MSEKLGPCPLCGGEAIHEEINTMAPEIAQCEDDGCEMANWMAVETWQKLSALAASEKRLKAEVEPLTADARRVEDLMRENLQLRLEQSARVLDTSEYRDLMEDRQKQVMTVFRMREALERCRNKFEEYAEQHELKAMSAQICGGMPREVREREIKARTNRDMAFMCNEALKGGEG